MKEGKGIRDTVGREACFIRLDGGRSEKPCPQMEIFGNVETVSAILALAR